MMSWEDRNGPHSGWRAEPFPTLDHLGDSPTRADVAPDSGAVEEIDDGSVPRVLAHYQIDSISHAVLCQADATETPAVTVSVDYTLGDDLEALACLELAVRKVKNQIREAASR